MRFNIASVCAVLAMATQLVTAKPAERPKWKSDGAQAIYLFGAATCTYGSYICNEKGAAVAGDTLAAAAFCCGLGAAAVPASETDLWKASAKKWEEAIKTIGEGAKVVKGKAGEYMSKSGKFIVKCTDKLCQMVERPASLPRRYIDAPLERRNGRPNKRRSSYRRTRRSSPATQLRRRKPVHMDYNM